MSESLSTFISTMPEFELKYTLESLSSASFVRPWKPSSGSTLPYTLVRTNDFDRSLGAYQMRLVMGEELVLQAASGLSPASSGSRSSKGAQPSLPSPVSLSLAVSQDPSLRRELVGLLNELIQPSSGLLESGALAARLRWILVKRDRRALLMRARGEEILGAFAAVEGCIAAAAMADAKASLAYLARCRASGGGSMGSAGSEPLSGPRSQTTLSKENTWPWVEETSPQGERGEKDMDTTFCGGLRSSCGNEVRPQSDLVGLVGHAESYALVIVPVCDVDNLSALAEAAFSSLPCEPCKLSPRDQLELLCSALGGVRLIRATVPCGSVRTLVEIEKPGSVPSSSEATRPFTSQNACVAHSQSFKLSLENAHAELSTGMKYVHNGRLSGELGLVEPDERETGGSGVHLVHEDPLLGPTPSLLSRIPGLRVTQVPLLASSFAPPHPLRSFFRPLDVILSLVSLDTGEVLWGSTGASLDSHALPLAYCAAVSEVTVPGWNALNLLDVLRCFCKKSGASTPRLAFQCARPTRLLQLEACLRDLPISVTASIPWPVEVNEGELLPSHDAFTSSPLFSGVDLFTSGHGMGNEVGSGLDCAPFGVRSYVPTGSESIEPLLESKGAIGFLSAGVLGAGPELGGAHVVLEGSNSALDSEGDPLGCDLEVEDGLASFTSFDPGFLLGGKLKRHKLTSAEASSRAVALCPAGEVAPYAPQTARAQEKDDLVVSFSDDPHPPSRPASTLVFIRGKSGHKKSISGASSRAAPIEEAPSIEDFFGSFFPGILSLLSPIPAPVNSLLAVALRAETRRVKALEAIQSQVNSGVVAQDEALSQDTFTGDFFAFKPQCSDFTTLLKNWASELNEKGPGEKERSQIADLSSFCSSSALKKCNLRALNKGSIQRILLACGFPTSGDEDALLLLCRLYLLIASPVIPSEPMEPLLGGSCSAHLQDKISFLAAADSLSTAIAASSQTSFALDSSSLWALSVPFSGSIEEEAGVLFGQYCYADLLLACPTFLSSLTFSQILSLSQGELRACAPGPVTQGVAATNASVSSQQQQFYSDGAGKKKRRSGSFHNGKHEMVEGGLGHSTSFHFSRGLGAKTDGHLRLVKKLSLVKQGDMLSAGEVDAESTAGSDFMGRAFGSLASVSWLGKSLHIPAVNSPPSCEGYDAGVLPPPSMPIHMDVQSDARKCALTHGESGLDGAPLRLILPPLSYPTKPDYTVLPEGAAALSSCEDVDWPILGKDEKTTFPLRFPAISPIYVLSALLGSCTAISLDIGKPTLLVSGRLPDPSPYLSRALLDATLSSYSLSPASVFPVFPLAFGGLGLDEKGGHTAVGGENETPTPSLFPAESSFLPQTPFPSAASNGAAFGKSVGILPSELLARMSAIITPESRRFVRRSSRGSALLLHQAHDFVSSLSTDYSPQPIVSDILADFCVGSFDEQDDATSAGPDVERQENNLAVDERGLGDIDLKVRPPATSSNALPPPISLQPALFAAKSNSAPASVVPRVSIQGLSFRGGMTSAPPFELPMVVPLFGVYSKDISAAGIRVLHCRSMPFRSTPSSQPLSTMAPSASPSLLADTFGVGSTPLSVTTPCWGRSFTPFAKSIEVAGAVSDNGGHASALSLPHMQDHIPLPPLVLPVQPPTRASLLASLYGDFVCICQRVTASHIASLARRYPLIDKYMHSSLPFVYDGMSIVGAVRLVRCAISSDLPPTTVIRQSETSPPHDLSTLYFNSLHRFALTDRVQVVASVLLSHSKVCTEAGRRRLGALIVEAGALGLHSLALTMVSWIPSDTVPLEEKGCIGEGGGALGFKPLNQWHFPARIMDAANYMGVADTIPYPRFIVEPFSPYDSSLTVSPACGGAREGEAIPPRISHCLVQYICEGSVSSLLGLRLYHPAAVLYFATRVLPTIEKGF